MYKYKIYLGYEKDLGGYPLLGEIDYNYPLSKGDTVVLSGELFDEISSLKDVNEIDSFKYRQTYIVASVNHWIDSPTKLADVYIMTDKDYIAYTN